MVKFFPKMGTLTNKLAWLGLLTFGLSLQVQGAEKSAAELLKPFEAVYYAYKWDDNLGSAKLSLQELSPGLYSLTYQSKVSKYFLSDKRFEHSIFTVDGDNLIPQEYNYSRTGTGFDKSLKAVFEPNDKPVINLDNEEEQYTLPWTGELDNQLYRLDISLRLEQGKSKFSYDFINYRGQQRHYDINVIGKESVTLPYGTIEAIKVEIARTSSSRETFAWFAPSLQYQLVRLQQFKDGEEQGDLRLKAFSNKTTKP